jgi:hypothetical protein
MAVAHLSEGTPPPFESAPLTDLLPRLTRGVRPYWGYEPASLLVMRSETFTLPGSSGGLVVQRANGHVRILAAVGLNELADRELTALLRQVAGDAHALQIYNEPDDSPLLAHYLRLGFTEFFSQDEMFLAL